MRQINFSANVLKLMLFGVMTASSAPSIPPNIALQAKVRDFKEVNPTDTVGMDSQFNNETGCSASQLGVRTVQDTIDTTGPADGGLFPGDNRGPKLVNPLSADIARCFSPVDRFHEWYSDQAPTLNRSFLVDLKFVRDDAAGVYRFQDTAFFPIDSGASFKKFAPTDPDPFGQLQVGLVDGVDVSKHNYGFTMELHTQFPYTAGKGQVFNFSGDDDIWVFINGICVVDRGGVHHTENGAANLDSLKTLLGLEDGKQYPLDFFFAERHTTSSTCTITTNLSFTDAISVVAAPTADPLPSASTSFPVVVRLNTGTDTAKIYYTLDESKPDSSKTLYANPITLTAPTVVKSIAYRDGWIASPVTTQSYGTTTVGLRPFAASHSLLHASDPVFLFDRSGHRLRLLPSRPGSGAGADLNAPNARSLGIPPGVYIWRGQAQGHSPYPSGIVLIP